MFSDCGVSHRNPLWVGITFILLVTTTKASYTVIADKEGIMPFTALL